jgi:hypothetical protein
MFEAERLALIEINRIAASDLSSAEKFSLLYANKIWAALSPGINRGQSLSGFGSTLEATCLLRPALEQFLAENDVQALFDAPCGDYHWMRHVGFSGKYIGGDIVQSVVDSLCKEFQSDPQFITLDITKDKFPDADVWLCRACLQHLCNDEIKQALANFAKSNVKMALLSNSRLTENHDIKTGGSRMVDLTKAPFNLPKPRQILPDSPCGEKRHIGVWHKDDFK